MNEKRNKQMLWSILTGVGLLVVFVGSIAGLDAYYNGKTLPNQEFAGVQVGGIDPKLATIIIKERWETLQKAELQLTHGSETQKISLADLGVSFSNFDKPTGKLRVYGKDAALLDLVGALVNQHDVPLYLRTDQIVAETNIYQKFENLYRRENAYFTKNEEGAIFVKPGKAGYELAWENTYDQILAALTKVELPVIELRSTITDHSIAEAALLEHQDQILTLVAKPLILVGEDQQWTYDFRADIDSLRFENWKDEGSHELPYQIVVSPDKWHNFIKTEISPKLDRLPDNVELKLVDNKVEFLGNGIDGQHIEYDKLVGSVTDWLNSTEKTTLEIPLVTEKAEIVADKALEKMGVVGLVATGYTTFYGSHTNRVHNIGVGLNKFNGLIIPAGETFSFNDNLGPVEAYTGYLPELVIKPEGTIPEYGGGLCQVSTTLYRALLNADLPITDRQPHSYAVSYYSQQLGHGLDATIYPGASDLQFINDTGGALVIQSFADGASATFNLYGTPVNKEVSYDGPYISNRTGAPAAVNILDNNMAPGSKKQVEKAHNGFDVLWYLTVKSADGTVEKKEVFSRYKAIPAKYIVGPSPEIAEQPVPAEPNS
ncbi:hypothetical protein COV81_05470 [Candidatus Peregrinibacteria bacterium CG11_big_fil_rev_8_21_14_0_20_41_10]|nr:MAG: hypothetical protein COV81_05470 [Candidatus Peregrinibacteria bacterium CG11_big_fil_rev_8_21_14_0_20_41_10]